MHVTTGTAPLPTVPDEVKQIVGEFVLKSSQYQSVMEALSERMDMGLKKKTHPTASVKMFPSYVTKLPSGHGKNTPANTFDDNCIFLLKLSCIPK